MGPGSSAELAQEMPDNDIYLIVTDPGLSKAGIGERLTQTLYQAKKCFHIFDKVVADAPIE